MTQTLQYATAKALDDAATLIETKGWCRKAFAGGDRHCTVGALHAVIEIENGDFVDDLYFIARNALRVEVGPDLLGWNDAQRDRRKVVRTLRRTARKVRRGEIPVW